VSVLQKFPELADADYMLDIVRECHHVEAEAFILNRRGDFDSAFKVYN